MALQSRPRLPVLKSAPAASGAGPGGFGTALRLLRERSGLAMIDVSRLSGVDCAYLHRLEHGLKRSPSPDTVSKLVDALDLSARDAAMLRWLGSRPDADERVVEYALDHPAVTLEVFVAAAGLRSLGGPPPDVARLIARLGKALRSET